MTDAMDRVLRWAHANPHGEESYVQFENGFRIVVWGIAILTLVGLVFLGVADEARTGIEPACCE